jgi:hypothetical protein
LIRKKSRKDWELPKITSKESRLAYFREYRRRRYLETPLPFKEKAKENHLLYKKEVLTYYGGGKLACVVCGEARLPCLSIDHIDGGGTKHRKELGISGSIGFYLYLRRQGYPEGYLTLCMNCQFIKKSQNREERKI